MLAGFSDYKGNKKEDTSIGNLSRNKKKEV